MRWPKRAISQCNISIRLAYESLVQVSLAIVMIAKNKARNEQIPNTLTVLMAINQVWLINFTHDQLEDCRSIRLVNVIDDFNR
jgi:hypothetical protein